MGHKNKKSLVKQIEDILNSKLAIGESKFEAKKNDTSSQYIYSWSTYKNYMKECIYFVKYCKDEHGIGTVQACRGYVNEWLQKRIDDGLSAYTIKLDAAALAKLYGCKTTEFIPTPPRQRDSITRSRGEKTRDSHFSESNHKDFVEFCKSTGLRRGELEALTGDKLIERDGRYYVVVNSGSKGGRYREAPVIGDVRNVVSLMSAAGHGKVFQSVPKGADVHGYRSEYATAIYKTNERDLETCKSTPFWNPEHINGTGQPKGGYDKDSVYWRRGGSDKGTWLDKQAMMAASRALGHDRISVVAGHYLRA